MKRTSQCQLPGDVAGPLSASWLHDCHLSRGTVVGGLSSRTAAQPLNLREFARDPLEVAGAGTLEGEFAAAYEVRDCLTRASVLARVGVAPIGPCTARGMLFGKLRDSPCKSTFDIHTSLLGRRSSLS